MVDCRARRKSNQMYLSSTMNTDNNAYSTEGNLLAWQQCLAQLQEFHRFLEFLRSMSVYTCTRTCTRSSTLVYTIIAKIIFAIIMCNGSPRPPRECHPDSHTHARTHAHAHTHNPQNIHVSCKKSCTYLRQAPLTATNPHCSHQERT